MRRLFPVVFLSLVACGGSTPTQPPPSQPLTWTLVGQVIGTGSGAPVAAATITSAAGNTTTTGDGRYTLTGTTGAPLRLTISASGYLTRETGVTVTQGSLRDLTLDVISEAPPFNRDLWEEMARDRLDNNGVLRSLAPWTGSAPAYVLKTTDDRGEQLPPGTITAIKNTIIATVQSLSGDRWRPTVTETTGSTADRPYGAIAVEVFYDANPSNCGQALVGALTRGYINLYVGSNGCSCNGDPMAVAPVIVAHETAHSLGAYHVSERYALLNHAPYCNVTAPTDMERYHAGILFQRRRGNDPPDSDPQGTALAQAESSAVPVVCRVSPSR